ncbi:DUF4223 domain-containing protein, partial [Salmonella enterica subsp. enterica serovar Newport]
MISPGKDKVLIWTTCIVSACTGHIENKKNNCSYDYL